MAAGEVHNPVQTLASKSKTTFLMVGLFSCAVNILMLTGPLFMLQVYDRVLSSRSVPTLVALFLLVVVLFGFLGLFDFLRSRLLSRAGYRFEAELMSPAKESWINSGLTPGKTRARPVNDLSTVRRFLCSSGLSALFDLPWIPAYLAIVYILHVWLGLLATAGAIIVVTATIIGELITKKNIKDAAEWELQDATFLDRSGQNSEAIIAMGMTAHVTRHWQKIRYKGLRFSQIAGGKSEFIIAMTKSVRLLLQSAMLALGAYLTIFQEISAGVMITTSILAGRALAPVDAAVGSWKNVITARQAYARLTKALENINNGIKPIQLPAPLGHISVTNLSKREIGKKRLSERKFTLHGIDFSLEPGDGLGVVGPSASGKSSLARLLVGLWMPDGGSVRLDKATFDEWDRDLVAPRIGYLPQSVELIPGTIAQNIARFNPQGTHEEIVLAAKLAGVHELILQLPDGYSTDLSSGDIIVTPGQAQRIGLARAVFERPALVVLDEPNSSLDAEGDAALTQAIIDLRKEESTVVVMAHRPSAIAAVNKILMLNNGNQVDFGTKDEVLTRLKKQSPTPDLRAV